MTKLHFFKDAELVRQLYIQRKYSDIIEELCRRLEQKEDQCPICGGNIPAYSDEAES
jgi:hypothetical protein